MTFVHVHASLGKIDVDLLSRYLRPVASPVPGVHLEIDNPRHLSTDAMNISIDDQNRFVIADCNGVPLKRVRRVLFDETNAAESVANSLRSIALIRTIKALSNYGAFSPLPVD